MVSSNSPAGYVEDIRGPPDHPTFTIIPNTPSPRDFGTTYQDKTSQVVSLMGTMAVTPEDSGAPTALYEEMYRIKLPALGAVLGEVDFQLQLPDPFKILQESAASYAIHTNRILAFKYLATIALSQIKGVESIKSYVRFRCGSAPNEKGVVSRVCSLTLYTPTAPPTIEWPLSDAE